MLLIAGRFWLLFGVALALFTCGCDCLVALLIVFLVFMFVCVLGLCCFLTYGCCCVCLLAFCGG